MVKFNATKKELRSFGYLMGGMLILMFGLLFPYWFDYQGGDHAWTYRRFATPQWPWLAASVFWLLALILPITLTPVYKIWMLIGLVLGWINTRIILAVVFYVVVFPIGLMLKLFAKDPMRRRLDDKLASYRIKSEQPETNHIERPY